jgi:hypothetical protein
MSCCGKNREQFLAGPLGSKAAPPASQHLQRAAYTRAIFEYIGNTGLTVVAPVTGRRYRFDHPGAQVEVDLRDRRSLAAVPLLRQRLR